MSWLLLSRKSKQQSEQEHADTTAAASDEAGASCAVTNGSGVGVTFRSARRPQSTQDGPSKRRHVGELGEALFDAIDVSPVKEDDERRHGREEEKPKEQYAGLDGRVHENAKAAPFGTDWQQLYFKQRRALQDNKYYTFMQSVKAQVASHVKGKDLDLMDDSDTQERAMAIAARNDKIAEATFIERDKTAMKMMADIVAKSGCKFIPMAREDGTTELGFGSTDTSDLDNRDVNESMRRLKPTDPMPVTTAFRNIAEATNALTRVAPQLPSLDSDMGNAAWAMQPENAADLKIRYSPLLIGAIERTRGKINRNLHTRLTSDSMITEDKEDLRGLYIEAVAFEILLQTLLVNVSAKGRTSTKDLNRLTSLQNIRMFAMQKFIAPEMPMLKDTGSFEDSARFQSSNIVVIPKYPERYRNPKTFSLYV